MPKAVRQDDGRWLVPEVRAEATGKALLDWKGWPQLCQKSIDADAKRCNVAIGGAVDHAVAMDRLAAATARPGMWSTLELLGASAVGVILGGALVLFAR